MITQYTVRETVSVHQAIEQIDKMNKKATLVVDSQMKLLGIFTDGDMRRYILKNGDLSSNITLAMNRSPVVFRTSVEAKKEARKKSMVVYPVVNEEGILTDVVFNNTREEKNRISSALRGVPLVIMAGGKGTRLYPYTKILPKALIPINDYTISELIIQNFCKYGCEDVHFILKDKANMIKAYFNDLDKKYNVSYVQEKEFLGTGGGLSLLKGKIHSTFIVSNCDILINDDLECIYRTHKRNENKITCVCAMKKMEIPYGVIKSDERGKISEITEKPQLSFLVNTGVYVLEPEVIDSLIDGEFIHLTDIAKKYIEKGEKVGVFPIAEEAWFDMGQFSEMEIMMKHFQDGEK